MKNGIALVLAATALGLTGCVDTVTQDKPGSMPAYRDRVECRYEKPVETVFVAAKRAFNRYGNITREGTMLSDSKEGRYLEGLLNQKRVWMRFEAESPASTSVIIQIRGTTGGTDLQMAGELQKRIEFELAHLPK